jgi:hypothetical protein
MTYRITLYIETQSIIIYEFRDPVLLTHMSQFICQFVVFQPLDVYLYPNHYSKPQEVIKPGFKRRVLCTNIFMFKMNITLSHKLR